MLPIPLGFFLRWTLPLFGLYWLNFDKSKLVTYEQYFIFFTTPKFDFSKVNSENPFYYGTEGEETDVFTSWLNDTTTTMFHNQHQSNNDLINLSPEFIQTFSESFN